MENSVTLVSISVVKTEKTRKDGKKSRQYYTATFANANDPFAPTVIRNVFQSHTNDDGTDCIWRGGNPEQVATFVGKQIPGAIVTRTVTPYVIGERTVNRYTTVVRASEDEVAVFKQCGHTIVKATESQEQPVANAKGFALNK